MRILLLTNNYLDRSRGGVELHVYNLAKTLLKAGHQVVVGRTTGGSPVHTVDGAEIWVLGAERLRQRATSAGRGSSLPVLRLAFNFVERMMVGRAVGKELLGDLDALREFDVIHHHDFITSYFVARTLRKLRIRQVWTNHLGEFLILARVPLIGKFLTRSMTRHFLRGIGPSQELADQSAVACPITFVPNGVDTDFFRPLAAQRRSLVRRAHGWRAAEKVVVVPRRWAPSKGVVFAARALSEPTWPRDTVTVFVGAGESDVPEYAQAVRSALSLTTARYEVLDSVTPAEMADILGAADLCLIPSLLEATSLSALEAMSAGLPLVATNVGGLPSLVDEGRTGRLVAAQDAASIASAVGEIAALPVADREAMGSAARRRVIKEYSWDSVLERMYFMYEGAQ